MSAKLVAYVRVSTEKQGASGLGLESQQVAIDNYARQAGATVVAKFIEVESGKRSDRPQLQKAIAYARRGKATLVVAKVDRLARNARFLLAVVESGVDVVFCDLPHVPPRPGREANLDEHGRHRRVGGRHDRPADTRALKAAKARGTLLGSARPGHWDGREEARIAGAKAGAEAAIKVRRVAATEAYADLLPRIRELRDRDVSFAAIAKQLNDEGHASRKGKPFTPMTVHRIIARAKSSSK